MTGKAIKELLHSTPFRAFTVHIAEKTPLHVPHPDFALLTQDERLLIVNTEESKVRLIDIFQISSVTTQPEAVSGR